MLGLPNVKTPCLEHLNDKRERSWAEQITSLLDGKYSDWRSPKGTYMVPGEFLCKNRPPDVGEETEKNFFDLLKNFGESHQEPMFVVHSYNFNVIISELNEESNKVKKKWLNGEHDFVIIHRIHGIMFFQVNRKYY